MPRKPPAEPIDHHYNIPRLNRAFWWTGLTLTVVFVLMIIADYTRDWKTIQRTFMRLDAKLTREAALAARSKALDEEHGKLIGELKAARAEVATQGAAAGKLQAKLKDLDPKIYLADQQYKFTKASFDAVRYQYEDALANTPKTAPRVKKEVDAIVKELDERTVHLAELKKQQADTQKELDAIHAKQSEIETTIEKKTAAFRLVRTKYAGMKQDTLFQLRNSPILDMINPSLRINQVQLPDQFINVNFMKIPKVDRCTTCHLGADRKGFEDPRIKNVVFRTHPSFHKMVGSESMHPATTFGCTPCHGGRDRATSFWSAGHSPMSEAQEKDWTQKYDWEFDKFNENPVLPLKYAEAGCYRCHTHEVNFPDAPTLDAGMRMVETLGCWGCHRIDGLDKQHLPKVGPSLEKVASKVSREWTTRWVMNPPVVPREHADAEFLLPRELRERVGPEDSRPRRRRRWTRTAASRTTRWSTRSCRTSTTSPARPTCPRSPARATSHAARSCSPSAAASAATSPIRTRSATSSGRTASSGRTSPASGPRPRGTGSTTGS